jgi:putative transposon-encoded protein
MEDKNKRELLKKVSLLTKEMILIDEIMKDLNVPEHVLEKKIKIFGNASHVILPKNCANKNKIIIN